MIRGEIRVNPETGEAALCTELGGVRYWAPLIVPPKRPDGMQEQVDSVEGWTVVYTPKPDTSLVVEVTRPPLGPTPHFVKELREEHRGSEWVDRCGQIWKWFDGQGWRWFRADGRWSGTVCAVATLDGPYREVEL